MKPKRRGSLKVTVLPLSRCSTTWSCFGSLERSRWKAPGVVVSAASTRNEPDMPRWAISVSPLVEPKQEIFRPPRRASDPPSRQALAEAGRERKADVLPPQLDLFDPRADHRRLEPAPDGLDLRQLRHCPMVPNDGEKRGPVFLQLDRADAVQAGEVVERAGRAFAISISVRSGKMT